MKLGLKEIGAVVALATAGCAEKSEPVQVVPQEVDQGVINEFNITLQIMTSRFKSAMSHECPLIAAGQCDNLMEGTVTEICVRNEERRCLDRAGLSRLP